MYHSRCCALLYTPRSVVRQLASRSYSMSGPVVTVNEGRLRGALKKLFDGSDYYSFKGIPYAQPPVGELRFQVTPAREVLEGSEDCLFLNVYTPSLAADARLPVMVFLHGGGFVYGSGDDELYGPEFLLPHGVALVTLNYRLEAFGFLCLDEAEAPGNAGLKDQAAALRWVRDNAARFGGDPGNVTLFGESAGGAAVTYHLLAPQSRGLFHRAAAQSGVCLLDWAAQTRARERAFAVARLLGRDTRDPREALDFLRTVPARSLVGVNSRAVFDDERGRGLPIRFAPVVEKSFVGVEPFLAEPPLRLLREGRFHRVPLVLGYNSLEGLVVARGELRRAARLEETPELLLPPEIARRASPARLRELGARLKAFYWGGRRLGADDVATVAAVATDAHFAAGVHRAAELCAASGAVYLYRFALSTELNAFKALLGLAECEGAAHVDELFYMFRNGLNGELYDARPDLREHVRTVTRLWTDFAKTGRPGAQWAPYCRREQRYLGIGPAPAPALRRRADRERVQFWRGLYRAAGDCDRAASAL